MGICADPLPARQRRGHIPGAQPPWLGMDITHTFLNLSAALEAASGHCLPQFGTSSSAKQSCLLACLLPLGHGWCPTARQSPSPGEEVSRKIWKWNCTRVKAQKPFLQMQFDGNKIPLSHTLNLALKTICCLWRCACNVVPSGLSSRDEWLQMFAFSRTCSH